MSGCQAGWRLKGLWSRPTKLLQMSCSKDSFTPGKVGLPLCHGQCRKMTQQLPRVFFPNLFQTGLRRGGKLWADLKQNPLVIKIWLAGWLWQTSEALNWRTRSRFFFGMLIQACAASGSKEPCKCKWSQKMSLWNKYQVCLWFSLLWCLLPIKR